MANDLILTKSNFTLITGACGGLGKSFVLECAKNGENLLLLGTSQAKLNALLEEFKDVFTGILVEILECNLADSIARKETISFIQNHNININKLINNAGVIIEGDLDRFSDEEIENAIQVNCVGTLDLTKKIIGLRDKNQKLEVLTVASVASSYPIPHMAVYSATKSFLVSMMTALSYEYKNKNVIFTTVCPGGMATNQAMKDSIKSMGLGGKLSTVSTNKVARSALRGLKKKKRIVIPGFFNKFLVVLSKPFSKSFLARGAGKIYKKSQDKRNF